MEKIFARWPSLKEMHKLLQLRVQLLESLCPMARDRKELEVLGGKPGVHPDKVPTKSDVVKGAEEASMLITNVFHNMDGLKTWDELETEEKKLGLQPVISTKQDLESAKKLLAGYQEPIKALMESTRNQGSRFSSARLQVSKQYSKATGADTAGSAGPAPTPKKPAKSGDGMLAKIPSDFEVKIATVDYKDGSFRRKMDECLFQGKPCVVINAPQAHELQQSELRLHLLVFKATATAKNETFLRDGHVAVPLGGGISGKKKMRKDLVSKLMGAGAELELASSAPGDDEKLAKTEPAEINEWFASASKELNDTTTTEFLQMGAAHLLMSGKVQIVLTDFMGLSKFAAMADSANTSGLSDGAGENDVPRMHPTKVVEFCKENLVSNEILKECGAFGIRFHTATLLPNHLLIVPPGFVKNQRVESGKGTAMMMSTPILTKSCAARASEYAFVRSSVANFVKPPPEHPVFRLMTLVSATLLAYSRSQPSPPPTAEPSEPPTTPTKDHGTRGDTPTPPKEEKGPDLEHEAENKEASSRTLEQKVSQYLRASSLSREVAVKALRDIVASFPKTPDTARFTAEARLQFQTETGKQGRPLVVLLCFESDIYKNI